MTREQTVLIISPQERFPLADAIRRAHAGDDVRTLTVGVGTDVKEELARVLEGGDSVAQLYFLGGVLTAPYQDADQTEVERLLAQGIYALPPILRALHRAKVSSPLVVKVVTTDAHVTSPAELPHPFAAAIYGLLRVYVREFRNARVYCEDLAIASLPTLGLDAYAAALVACQPELGLTEVATRNGKRMSRGLQEVELDAQTAAPLRKEGVYVIVGGSGGIGYELSKWLAEQVRARLVWIGRSALDDDKRTRMQTIVELGGEALYISADVGDEASLKAAITQVKLRFGAIHGVFQSALVLDDRPLLRMDRAAMERVCRPKIHGSVSVWRCFAQQPLDFLAFFSSSQYLAANPGQANYAAGSAFMDSFGCWAARTAPFPVRTINWGFWGSVGRVASEEYRKRFESLGVYSIEPEQGMEAVRRILANPVEQVLAFAGAESMFIEHGLSPDTRTVVLPRRPGARNGTVDLRHAPLVVDRASYAEVEQLSCELTVLAMQQLGFLRKASDLIPDRAAWAKRGVAARHEALWEELLRMLTREGFLRVHERGLVATESVEGVDIETVKRRARRISEEAPGLASMVSLLLECGTHLADILLDKTAGTDVLFSRTNRPLLDAMYVNNPTADYYNGIVAAYVAQLIAQAERAGHPGPLRILEVGSGTGGTTRDVLKAIGTTSQAVEYFYTDISKAFLRHGKTAFGAYPFVRYELFDVTQSPASQGFELGSFDVVLATNVLHATPDLSVTLGNLKRVLGRDGEVIINEATASRGFTTLIFGILEGWWAFKEPHSRLLGSPLLDVPLWDRALRDAGFRRVRALGTATDGQPVEQHVMVASSDGVVSEGPTEASEQSIDRRAKPTRIDTLMQPAEPPAPAARVETPPQKATVSAPAKDWSGMVRRVVSEVLELQPSDLESDEPFADMGVDSVMAVEIARQIEDASGLTLRGTDLFNYGSVTALSAHLNSQRAGVDVQLPAHESSLPAPLPVVAEVIRSAVQARAVGDVSKYIATVAATVARTLEMDPADVEEEEPFVDMGVDSVMAVQIADTLADETGVALRSTDLFDHSSIRALAQHLAAQASDAASSRDVPEAISPPTPTPVRAPAVAQPSTPEPSATSQRSVDFHDMDAFAAMQARVEETPVRQAQREESYPMAAAYESPAPALGAAQAASASPASAVTYTSPVTPHQEAKTGAKRIAVIGMSGRFAGARNPDALWQLLREGRSAVHESSERWDIEGFYGREAPELPEGFRARAGFLDDVFHFDSLFFGISPKEAELMDPQQRLAMEEGYRALEDAGYSRELLKRKRCGAYVGCATGDYLVLLKQLGIVDDASLLTGNQLSMIASRLSYMLDLTGPAIATDAACASSLVSIDLACSALMHGDVEMALAGGVVVLSTPGFSLFAERVGIVAEDGKCKTFDQRADGMVPGEGVGMLVLKRLDDALRDGDHVYGVIVASGSNQDGRTNGITAPSAVSQAELEAGVYRDHGIDPRTIDYVECHGTGTKLGDPIEVQALTDAFRKSTDARQFCGVGSIKTNIGHTLSAAGVASVMKVLLSLENEALPPSLHFDTANEHIDFERSPFFVQTELTPWQRREGKPRRAAISSFGFSGTNVHMVVEEAPRRVLPARGEGPHLFVLSARTPEALAARARDLASWIDRNARTASPGQVAYTLLCRRSQFEHRWAAVAHDLEELRGMLDAAARGDESQGTRGRVLRRDSSTQQLDLEVGRYLLNELGRASSAEATGRLTALAALFVKGVDLDWLSLCAERQTVSLPTYPFESKRLLPASRIAASALPSTKEGLLPVARALPATDQRVPTLLERSWRTLDAHQAEQTSCSGTWILLASAESRHLAEAFQAARHPALSDCTFRALSYEELEAGHPQALEIALQKACAEGSVRGVIDLSDLFARDRASPEPVRARLELMQGVVKHWLAQRQGELSYLHLTQGVAPLPGPNPSLRGSLFAGLAQVLAAEHAGLLARTVDVDLGADGQQQAWLDLIVRELGTDDGYVESCWRGGRRYVPDFVEAPQREAVDFAAECPAHGFWVVTGGLGGIGGYLAKKLVARGLRQIVLTGRRKLSEMPKGSAEATRRIRLIEELEASGATVRVYEGSLEDRSRLNALLAECHRDWGKLHGVLHCAGAVSEAFRALVHSDTQEIERVLEPKVGGLRCLVEAVTPYAPGRLVLFSSVSSLCPSLAAGIGSYALANGFMNRLASFIGRTRGMPLQSIAWSNWEGEGFGEIDTRNFGQSGLLPHSPEQGLALLDRMLGASSVLALAGTRASEDVDLRPLLRRSRAVARTAQPPALQRQARSDEQLPSAAPLTTHSAAAAEVLPSMVTWVRSVFSQELHVDMAQIEPTTSFQDVGVDSILMVEILRRIETQIDGKLEPSALLEHPRPLDLATYLLATFPELPTRLHRSVTQPVQAPVHAPITAEAQEPSVQELVAPRFNPVTPPAASRQEVTHAGASHAIAIIGIGCHLPGAVGPETFWKRLSEGYSGISEVPKTRWDADLFYAAKPQASQSISKWGGFIEGIEEFDPEYFGLPAETADQIDPLIRQFLEVSAECLADAGYAKEEVKGKRVGVFVGARSGSYAQRIEHARRDTPTAIGQNFIAAHVSHYLDLHGPALVTDTACSSSLTSLHMACQSLRAGESELALAGGVDLLLDETPYLGLTEAKALSPDGRCFTFDERANGFVPGEGAGVVLLKTLQRALEDGDRIYAVIEGSAVNNDGRTMGITTPNPEAQAEVIERALADAGVNAATVSYLETHGTGTLIGDPIELKAASSVYRRADPTPQFCTVGSVKPNIGHLMSAAGIASVIKTALSLFHGKLVPSIHCETPNPRFAFSQSPFRLSATLQDWVPPCGTRRAGISSFGFGGTNVHAILSEAPVRPNTEPVRRSLPPAVMKRRRFWLERKVSRPAKIEQPVEQPMLLQLAWEPPKKPEARDVARATGLFASARSAS